MGKRIEERTNKGFEIQYYNEQGDNKFVMACNDVTEVAEILAQRCWSSARGSGFNPTIWLDGKRWPERYGRDALN
jgi:hypothetical protein